MGEEDWSRLLGSRLRPRFHEGTYGPEDGPFSSDISPVTSPCPPRAWGWSEGPDRTDGSAYRNRGFRVTSWRTTFLTALCAGSLLGLGVVATPATAADADHGDQLVIEDPVNHTPHVMINNARPARDPNPSVDAIVQVGNTIIAGGSLVELVSPAGTFDDRTDDVAVNGLFAFNATTGAIDTSFDPGFADGADVRSLTTDGTSVYVGGQFRIGSGDAAFRRVVKLSPAGVVDPAFHAVPNRAVNEVVFNGGRL